MKQRIAYADFLASQLPDFNAMEFEKTPLLLDGEPCIYAGDNGNVVWLKFGRKVRSYHRDTLRGPLKLATGTV